jgi:predicted Fe-Mo cluster-binding NifX family protein
MKVAIPVWGDRISPVFDTATRLMVVDTSAEKRDRISLSLEGDDLTRRCSRMQELGVDTLICGAISNPFCRRLTAVNIEVIQGIFGAKEDVLQAFLKGELNQKAFRVPCCRSSSLEHKP